MGIQLAPAQNVYKHYLQGLQTTEVLYHMKYTDLGERVCRQCLFSCMCMQKQAKVNRKGRFGGSRMAFMCLFSFSFYCVESNNL